MGAALTLARRGLGNVWPNPAVGCVIVNDGRIVGRGWTQPGGRPHAETEALARAGEAARGATLYVTLEPCCHHGRTPPCTDAIIAAGIARVVSAIEDPNPQVAGRGHALLRASGIAVEIGESAAQARHAHAGQSRRVRDGRPHVTLKLAVSADGKAALAGRRPVAITAEAARARVHMMRAMNDALVTGIGTILSDDPLLTCRLPGMEHRSPVRVVFDTHRDTPRTSRLVTSAGTAPVLVFAGPDAPADQERVLAPGRDGVEVVRLPLAGERLDIDAALAALAARGITRVMLEAGPRLAAAFLAADRVDEAVLLQSPEAIGADGIDALEATPLSALTHSPRLSRRPSERIGRDIITLFERAE
jgi:diaminohydroxyphosphoribosylaminopyrimidine deaminase/5-amino-6-(5-phosphoribosylamino)uracil reductase